MTALPRVLVVGASAVCAVALQQAGDFGGALALCAVAFLALAL